jgi:acyl carrier protein
MMQSVPTDGIVATVRAYVRENFLYAKPDLVLGDDGLLLEQGVIDSMGVIELVEFLQGEFGIRVADDEITEDNLGSIAAIARYVSGKSAGGQKVPSS